MTVGGTSITGTAWNLPLDTIDESYVIASDFVPFTFGSLLDISASLAYDGSAEGYAQIASVSLPQVYLDIRGADMGTIGYQEWSKSGIDYPAAVPEPTALSMLAIVGAAFCWQRIRTRKRA